VGKKRVRRSFIEIVSVIFEKWHQKKAACEQEAFESLSLGGLSGEIIDRERRDTTFKSILRYLRSLLQINSDDFILGFLQNDSKGLTWIFDFLQLFGSEEGSIVIGCRKPFRHAGC
jgi:hypothetical protein